MSIESMKHQLAEANSIMMDAPYEATIVAWEQVNEHINAAAEDEENWRTRLTNLQKSTLVVASGGTMMCGQAVTDAEAQARAVLMDTVTLRGEALLEGLRQTLSSAKLLWAANASIELGIDQMLERDDAHKDQFMNGLRAQSEGIVVNARDLSRLALSTEVLFQDCIHSL